MKHSLPCSCIAVVYGITPTHQSEHVARVLRFLVLRFHFFPRCFVGNSGGRKHHEARKKPGGGMYGHAGYSGTPMMGYGFMDPTAGQNPYSDYYGGAYGRPPHLYNAYGQPMAAFFPPHMPMCPPGNMEVLPASIQLRLDHLAAIGFCQPGEIDDRWGGCELWVSIRVEKAFLIVDISAWDWLPVRCCFIVHTQPRILEILTKYIVL